jgi:integrase/recombinase XerD
MPAQVGERSQAAYWIARFTQRLLEEQRVSASTLQAYTLDMAIVSRWAAGQERDVLSLTASDLARYVTERQEGGTHLSTIARHISSCRRFYAFLEQEGVIATNPVALLVVPPGLRQGPAVLPIDALRVLLRSPDRRFPTDTAALRAQRDHALVCTVYGTDLGISDVRLLRWEQIDERSPAIRLPMSRGKARSFECDARLLLVLQRWRRRMASADIDPNGCAYCFPSASGRPMTRQGLSQVIRKWAEDCGRSEVVTPSALRQAGLAGRSMSLVRWQFPQAASGQTPA